MRSLSKEAERTLIAAIEKAAELVNDGLEPNAAIIKSAAEANIPAGHVNLMVHAYNTGRTTKQREHGQNALEKAADFALADADIVLNALYPKQVKTSGEMRREHAVSTEYAVSAAGMLARRRDALRKSAAAQQALPAPTWTPPPRDEHAAVMRAQSEKVAAQRADEELRRQATVAHTKAAAAMEELHLYFRRPGNMSFNDAVREVGLRFGDAGVSVLDKVANVYPHLQKQAATKKAHFGDDAVYGLVENVVARVQEYTAAQQRVPEKKANEFSKKETPEFITGSILHNPADEPLTLKEANVATIRGNDGRMQQVFIDRKRPGTAATPGGLPPQLVPFGDPFDPPPPPERPRPPTPPLAERAKSVLGVAGMPVRIVGTGLGMSGLSYLEGQKSAPKDPQAKEKAQFNKLNDPSHESALKSLRAKGVLHDLILNDPVVSGYDPQDVAMAFNDISELAPGMIDSPGMLQSVLRKRLEAGQMADFDVKQLLEMDKLRAERDKLQAEARRVTMDTLY